MFTGEQVIMLINPESAKYLRRELNNKKKKEILDSRDLENIKEVADYKLQGDLRLSLICFNSMDTHARETTLEILRKFHGV
jgi:hypothetical protein